MSDLILEIIRAMVVSIIFIYLWIISGKEKIRKQEGWLYILMGFGLILFGMFIDITDNFPSLNHYIIIGDTKYQAFFEKVAGYLLGFILLAVGFWKWMPTVIRLRQTERALKKSQDELELKVLERTNYIEREMAKRKQAKIRLEKEFTAITTVLDNMLRGEVDDEKTEEQVLDVCLTVTDSVYGMIGIVNEHGKFDTTTYSSRSIQDCAFPEALAWEMSTGMTIRGIWGYPMLQGKPLLCNDLQAHPDRVGFPEGHVPITCFMGAPLIRDEKVIGMVAVANKPGGYTEANLEILIRLTAVISVSRQHRMALQSSKKTSAELEQLVKERTFEILKTNEQLKREIDKHQMTEKELREKERFQEALLNDMLTFVGILNPNGDVIFINNTPLKVGGLELQDLKGKKFYDTHWWTHSNEVRKTVKGDVERCATGESLKHDVQIRTADGSLMWIEYSMHPVLDEYGAVQYLIPEGRDITDRKQADEALQKSEEKYRLLAHNMNDVVFIQDINHNITYTSPSVTDIFGYSVEETYELKIKDLMTEASIRKAMKSFQKYVALALEKEDIDIPVMEYEYVRKDGSTFWGELKVTFLRDPKGKLVGSQGAIRDITHRKKTEAALKNSEELFRDMVEKLPFPLAVGTTDNRTEYVNTKFTEVFGYTVEDIPDQKTWREKFFPNPDYRAEISREVDRWIEKGEYLTTFDRRYTDKRSRQHDVIVTVMNLKERFYNIIEDITDHKQAEKEKEKLQVQLHQAQKMESIGNLAGGIAHDFNNLLYPIVGMAELLLEDLPADSQGYENAEEILKAGIRGSDLVKQILAFSRQSEVETRPVRIQHILKETLKLGRSVIPSNIEIRQDIQNDCGLVLADPTQLHQVAMNLITNAYHAVEQNGGTISVQLAEKEMDSDALLWSAIQSGRYAVLSISDTGDGIDPAIMDKIFDPYFTTKEQGKGTGLGLAVVYGIVREHQGDIKVSSSAGNGTNFDVYFPIMAKTSERVFIEKQESYETGTERILLVDDEEPIGRLERQMLTRLGYNVTSRTSSLDALALFQAEPDRFDLVITDMAMPNMTGDQFAVELISIRPDIPVIICTGFSERINKEMAKDIGIKGFLMKPVVKSEMAQLVRNVLDEAKGLAQK